MSSSINRILARKKNQNQSDIIQNQYLTSSTSNVQQIKKINPEKQIQFQQYAKLSQSNPQQYIFSTKYLPYSGALYSKYFMPLSLSFTPTYTESQLTQKNADKIPRCASCRAYLNYYNKVNKKGFNCFICGRDNNFLNGYLIQKDKIQLQQPCYQVFGPTNYYEGVPPENAIIFLIDLNESSYQSKMLYYACAVIKQVLMRQEMADAQVHFFTYDQVVHEYDFTGDEVKCTIIDQSINEINPKIGDKTVSQIQQKIFNLLDSLEQLSQSNKKQGSNFYGAFKYVYETTKHLGGRIFIFQCNEGIVGQYFMQQNLKNNNQVPMNRPKSILQSKNKTFYNQFVPKMLRDSLSCCFFIFARNYKNIKVFADLCKLTNSNLFLYKKDSSQDLLKFYYDFSYYLGTTNYQNVHMEYILNPGWQLHGLHSSSYRSKEQLTFKMCNSNPSTKIFLHFAPQQAGNYLPYFSLQIVVNYIYNRQHFMIVNTLVLPLTQSLNKLYNSTDLISVAALLHKSYLSQLRTQNQNVVKNKLIRVASSIWKAAVEHYKQSVDSGVTNLMLGILGFLKSFHHQIDSINDTTLFDEIISQRNFLQNCSQNDIYTKFNPYLFDLSDLKAEMCCEEGEFVYPPIKELLFSSVNEGVFLMDNCQQMYLFIARKCDPLLLKNIFGKQKFTKHDHLNEQSLQKGKSQINKKIITLINVLRQQRITGWTPLYIIRNGQNSLLEKMFYMNFYAEKYQEFRNIRMHLNEFLKLLISN